MGTNSLLKSPKKEHVVPDSVIDDFFETDNDNLSEFKGNLGNKNGESEGEGVIRSAYDELNWDHLIEWDEFEDQASGVCDRDKLVERREGSLVNIIGNIKGEICGIWQGDEDEEDDDQKNTSLNLSLNYQEVIDAWSDRGPCRADDSTYSTSDNGYVS